MSDYGGEQGPTLTSGLPLHQTPDFFSRYITKNATEIQINGSPIQLLKTPSNAYDSSRSNGLTPPPLAFSPSPTKFVDDGSAALNSSFCHSLNVDECVAFLDQEIRVLGFGSIYHENSRSLDIIKLVNCMHSVLNKYQNGLRVREEIENRQKRTDSDMENMQISLQRLKEVLNQKERDAQQAQESERQAKARMKNLTDLLKAEKDEVRRLNSVIQHKDAQYKHDLKKKEREHNKLKETLQSRRVERNAERKAGLEMSETLLRPDGKRARWKTQETHDGELFRTVISDYEDRQKDLLSENSELRQCLKNLQKEITNATSQPNLDNSFSSSDSEESDDLERLGALEIQSENELTEGLFEMPFSMVRENLQKLFRSRLRSVRRLNKQLYRNSDEPNGNITAVTEPSRDCLKHEKEIERLKKQVERYRSIIQQQEVFIQDRLDSGVGGDSLDSSILRESYLYDEYDALEHERNMLQHEKALISEEKRYLNKTKQQLSRQQQALDEQTNLVKNQFFNITPFRENGSSLSLTGSTARRKQRILPSTPRFSSSSPAKTPTTAQLYRFLGLEARVAKFDANSDGEGDDSMVETSPDIESPKVNLFNTSNANSRNLSPCASPCLTARINEHKENIKMTLMHQRGESPDDFS